MLGSVRLCELDLDSHKKMTKCFFAPNRLKNVLEQFFFFFEKFYKSKKNFFVPKKKYFFFAQNRLKNVLEQILGGVHFWGEGGALWGGKVKIAEGFVYRRIEKSRSMIRKRHASESDAMNLLGQGA